MSWPEALAGRKAEEMASCYDETLMEKQKVFHLVYWVLFAVTLVNSHQVGIENITLKYFETAHIFMSANSIHHDIEVSIT